MAVAQTANAQCPVEEANVWYDQTPLGTQTAQCMTLLQGKPWSGTRDLDTHGWATRDITFLDPFFAFQFWQDVTWQGTASAAGEPMPAAIYGLDVDPQGSVFTPKVRNLTTAKWSVVDADLHLIDYRLKFRGADNVLSLDNATIRLIRPESSDLTQGPLTISISANSHNEIHGMEGQPGGPIHLSLGSDQTLVFKGSGSTSVPENDLRNWWSDPFNQVVIGSGGVLTLDESYLIVATQNASGNVGNFEIRDGGKVELRTGETTLSVDYLKVVNGGVLDLGPATSLTGPTNDGVRQLDLNAAEIIGQQGAQAALRSLNVSGTSDVTLDSLADIRANYLSLGDATTRLNILRAGSGSDPATLSLHDQSGQSGAGLVTAGGDIYVAPGATLGFGDPRVFGTPEPASIVLTNGAASPSIIRVDAGATASLIANATLALADSDTNPPIFNVQGDFWIGGEFLGVPSAVSRYTIEDTSVAGTGQVIVGFGGKLVAGAGTTGATVQRILEIQPALRMYFGGEVSVQLFPQAGFSNVIEVGGEFLLGMSDFNDLPEGQLTGYPDLRLPLLPEDDATLPLGTKLVLFDYDPSHPPSGLVWFKGFGEGYTFTKGLNQYQIRYSDPEYGAVNGGNDSVITLTVVSREVLDDVYTATENSVLVEVAPGVLANDPLYINTGGGLPQVVSLPAHGTVEMYSDGGFVYTPAPDFVGLDTFEYVVLDGPFTSERAVVWIEVLPGAPAAIPVAVPALSRFGLLVLAVLALGLGLVGVRRMI